MLKISSPRSYPDSVKTPWFPVESNPTYPGLYEVQFIEGSILFSHGSQFLFWDGKTWVLRISNLINTNGAPVQMEGALNSKISQWRGLKQKPFAADHVDDLAYWKDEHAKLSAENQSLRQIAESLTATTHQLIVENRRLTQDDEQNNLQRKNLFDLKFGNQINGRANNA